MKEHMNDCFKYGGQKTNMPEEGKNIIEFNDIAKQQQLPFCIYADTECILTKVDNGKKKNSTKLNKHEISGYGYTVVSPYFPTMYKHYRGKVAVWGSCGAVGGNALESLESGGPVAFGTVCGAVGGN